MFAVMLSGLSARRCDLPIGLRRLCFHTCWTLTMASSCAAVRGEEIRFSKDIRPILSDACFRCHGSDESNRRAELRLDRRNGVFAIRQGRTIVVPRQPQASELIRRITSADPDLRMPPAEADRPLTDREIGLFQDWVEQGATWSEHWAYVPPQRPPLPRPVVASGGNAAPGWPRNAIDLFVLAQLRREGLLPSPQADRERLARRVALTLTGLPPDPTEVARFVRDRRPDAYDRWVNRLLASPRYGEHAALAWLDLARYADTDGYQDDQPRVMWRWRDWLITALNDGMPFDQFTLDLLAGDLQPNASDWQRLATGFHRNHRTNGEGGSIEEEFRVEYVVDCVETTSTVWMGLTLGCCRCHDHKYDPFSQRDFYRLFAFFNNTPEKGVYRGNGSPPLIKVPTDGQQRRLDELDRLIAAAATDPAHRKALQQRRDKLLDQVASTMIMAEGKPRETFILQRGQYDQPGDRVTVGVPSDLSPLPTGAPSNRLGLAQWLVDPDHPVTARVAVNRMWTLHFGSGLVKTPEDFGSQGEPPSHPALLDWLATRFMETGWDVKGLHRMIVTSATYRQASLARPRALVLDPETRYLWRFPRWRLKAEQIRDRALEVSGLLVERLGGPSVKPYQPPGLWNEIAGGSTSAYKDGYQRARGTGLYRRSLYTFWRRTIPPPGMTAFDAPTRETCTARRAHTNTPLQALALLNDVTYLEAARLLGERMLLAGAKADVRIRAGFRLALSRDPTAEELDLLVRGYRRLYRRFERRPAAAAALARVGDSVSNTIQNEADLAACMAIGNTLLNLDEFVVVE